MPRKHRHPHTTRDHRLRHLQASIRDTSILLKEFQSSLFWFTIAIIGGGVLYDFVSRLVGEPVYSLAESIYIVFTAAFMQPPIRYFPHHTVLQRLHFFMPTVGIIALAQGLADIGGLLFNRKARNTEWEMAVASTLSKHTI